MRKPRGEFSEEDDWEARACSACSERSVFSGSARAKAAFGVGSCASTVCEVIHEHHGGNRGFEVRCGGGVQSRQGMPDRLAHSNALYVPVRRPGLRFKGKFKCWSQWSQRRIRGLRKPDDVLLGPVGVSCQSMPIQELPSRSQTPALPSRVFQVSLQLFREAMPVMCGTSKRAPRFRAFRVRAKRRSWTELV